MSLVVYENLLLSAHFVQAGGKDKIPTTRQEIHCLLFSLLKGYCKDVSYMSGSSLLLARTSCWEMDLVPHPGKERILDFYSNRATILLIVPQSNSLERPAKSGI
jgi:hypothetical protein